MSSHGHLTMRGFSPQFPITNTLHVPTSQEIYLQLSPSPEERKLPVRTAPPGSHRVRLPSPVEDPASPECSVYQCVLCQQYVNESHLDTHSAHCTRQQRNLTTPCSQMSRCSNRSEGERAAAWRVNEVIQM